MIGREGSSMPSAFENVTILLPAMDETYSLKQTVDIIAGTNQREDIRERNASESL